MGSKLFGSSGARGRANVDLTPDLFNRIGSATAIQFKIQKAFVARDTRVSSLTYEYALVSGLLAGGTCVTSLGVTATPVLAYLTRMLGADAGFMITASHNPAEYNGLKIFNHEGMAYDSERQEKIEGAIRRESLDLPDWHKVGKCLPSSGSDAQYIEMVRKKLDLRKKWHIAVDSGGGATYHIAPTLFKMLGCKVMAINAQPDGLFKGRSPEPNADSLKLFASIVKDFGIIGIAYDGDGDRVAFIDETGSFADFDRVLAAYARYVLSRRPGSVIVTNVEASMCIEKIVDKYEGKLVRGKVGDVYVADCMKRHNAVFGGEPCGAWIHPQFNYCPDGVLSSVLLLKALEDENKSLHELVEEMPQYPTLRQNIPCHENVKCNALQKLETELRSAFPASKDISKIDGVRLSVKGGWILVRASGTEPLIRLTVEGETLEAAIRLKDKTVKLVGEILGELEK